MPIYTELVNADTVNITVRGDFNSMKKQPGFSFRTVENTINNNKETNKKMESLFPKVFKHTIPVMRCGVPLKMGITYPKELWKNVISHDLFMLPVYGQKDDPDTKVGEVSEMVLRGDILYATVDIDTSTSWGVYAKNELAGNGKLWIKPYLLCKLDKNKVINPDDFIMKSFYLVDYPEDTELNQYQEQSNEVTIDYQDIKKETDKICQEERKGTFKVENTDISMFKDNSNIFTSKDMPSNKELLDRFNATSNTEELFSSASSL